ncbi:MAG: hypothetical protein JWM60_1653 [Solirubrobacterales bacterium]|nr:hypothetical protein [Solirubrobacterales bacterium]
MQISAHTKAPATPILGSGTVSAGLVVPSATGVAFPVQKRYTPEQVNELLTDEAIRIVSEKLAKEPA